VVKGIEFERLFQIRIDPDFQLSAEGHCWPVDQPVQHSSQRQRKEKL
jgi:hypothetical protein